MAYLKFYIFTCKRGSIFLFFFFAIILNSRCSEKETLYADSNRITGKTNNHEFINIDSVADDTILPSLERKVLLFIGTYTWGSSKGIYLYELDTLSGHLNYLSESPEVSNPSYIAIHPNKKWVFAVNENSSGMVTSLNFDTFSYQITVKNSVSAKGDAPCYISIDNSGNYVMVANYNSGNVTVCPINADGSLGTATSANQHTGSGPVSGRQDGPHAHMIKQTANNFVYSTDLGIDKVVFYNLDKSTGVLTTVGTDVSVAAGSGPRHIAFHPNQSWAYVICELSGTIEAFTINNITGEMSCFDTISNLPQGVTAAAASADIHISPDGRFLYASNRGSNNNIAMYSINQLNGKLTLLGHQPVGGTTPRNFAIDPSGKYLVVACQDDSKVIVFQINQETGLLISTGIQISVPNPVCIVFLNIYKEKSTTAIKEYYK